MCSLLRVHASAENSVFRLEVPVAGDLTEPGKYTFEHIRCGEKWLVHVHSLVITNCFRVMEVERGRHLKCFAVALQAPESVKTFSHKPYVRTYDHDIQYGKPVNVAGLVKVNRFKFRRTG